MAIVDMTVAATIIKANRLSVDLLRGSTALTATAADAPQMAVAPRVHPNKGTKRTIGI